MLLRNSIWLSAISNTGLSPSMAFLSRKFLYRFQSNSWLLQPRQDKSQRFRLLPFRSPLLRKSHSLSSPLLTEMFHFSRFAALHLYIQCKLTDRYIGRVSPFGNPRIKARLPLPEAYRSCPRPSSPDITKASTYCPIYFSLSPFYFLD